MLRIICAVASAQPECAPCHPSAVEQHTASNHARTLRPAAQTPFARALPDRPIGEARGGFLLSYLLEGDHLRVRAARGAQSAEGRIEWVLGAGDQGLTPLVRFGADWLEHRISYYPKQDRFDLTLGHLPGPSKSAKAALGVVQPEGTRNACLGCHGGSPPGLSCRTCHANASLHISENAHPGKPSPLCVECHRLTGPDDALAVRFQPLRLVKSKCFSTGKIVCANCHPAHRDAVRNNPAFYRAQCAACHSTPHAREERDCLPCHMPKSTPAPYLTFTDHYIRVPGR
ncbi:MAG: hypothetical protein JNM66_16965 [Bryobacterales bacterium]|nr:hypothetical protein [Bryobacterales bacterium]